MSIDHAGKPLTVACPKCAMMVIWSTSNPHRPFCSARCKGVDLGAWANDEYRVASDATETDSGLPEHNRGEN